jgi:hypothetical protein
MSYTTEQLLQILDQELRAAWRGERQVLSSAERLQNSVVAKALGSQQLSKVFAVQDFRDQIHQYQHDHQVSGLVWHTCRFKGKSIRFPELHPQLTAIPADKLALTAAKASVVEFWRTASQGMRLWQADQPPRPVSPAQVEQWIAETEWAEIDATRSEIYLSLCWGDPKLCRCEWAKPESGCEQVIAAIAEPSPIKL